MIRYLFFTSVILTSLAAEPDRKSLFKALHTHDASIPGQESLYRLDFTEHENESTPLAWFKKHGFIEKFASKIQLGFRHEGILFEASSKRTAVFLKQHQIEGATKIKILWKVLKYPAGANWEDGNAYSAISVNVAFGDEKFPSGHFFLPAAPRFFSLFPGQHEPEGKFYQHKYYKDSSRHVCVASAIQPGEWITTEFELPQNFQKTFGIPIPPISGFGIAIHTSGESKALLKTIEFLN